MQYGRPVFQEQQLNIESWAAVFLFVLKHKKSLHKNLRFYVYIFQIFMLKKFVVNTRNKMFTLREDKTKQKLIFYLSF